MKEINIGAIDLRNPEDPEVFSDVSFEMSQSYKPTTERDLIQLNGKRILTNGNLMLIVVNQGVGKSSIAEALVASALNKSSDSFGFLVNSAKTLLIDTERVKNDIHRGWKKLIDRASLYKLPNAFDGDKIRGLEMRSYKFLKNTPDYLKHLKYHASQGFELIIIDQVADFLMSINNEEEAKTFVVEAMQIAEQNDCGMIFTIHPNPKDKDFKARGHIGTMLQHKCETVMAAFRAEDGLTIFTADYDQGKVRNGKRIGTSFMWDEVKSMHVSAYLSDDDIKKKINKEYIAFDVIIEELYQEEGKAYSQEELLKQFKLKMNNIELEFTFIEAFIAERKSIYKSEMDNLYYKSEMMDMDAPF